MSWLRHVLVVALGVVGLLGAPDARTETTCTVDQVASGLSFGLQVNPSGVTDVPGTIKYQCSVTRNGNGNGNGNNDKAVAIQMCFGLDAGNATTRWMVNATSDQLAFELYRDQPRSQPWDASFLEIADTIPAGQDRIEGAFYVHGRIPAQSGIAAGSYASSIAGTLRYGYRENGDASTLDCAGNGGQGSGSESFPFIVDATVPPSCTVITASDMNFSPGGLPISGSSTGNLTSTSTIGLTCTNRTAWRVGLKPDVIGGNWEMCNPGNACIAYQLTQPDGVTPWGDGEDDSVDGISSGIPQTLTVNGRVNDQALTQAGRYSDTVKVILTY